MTACSSAPGTRQHNLKALGRRAGAISVYTTQALLKALGMSRGRGEAAAAINWVLKDGAGRLGRFLFARWWVSEFMVLGWAPRIGGGCGLQRNG